MRITENNLNSTSGLLEEILKPENLNRAYAKVKRNKGNGGIDGMGVEDLYSYLKENKDELWQIILEGKYKPNPIRRVEYQKGLERKDC